MKAPLDLPKLCGIDGCRLLHEHEGKHDRRDADQERDVGHVELPRAHLESEAHGEDKIHENGRGDVDVVRVPGQEGQTQARRCEQPIADQRPAQSGTRRHRRAPAGAQAGPRSP